MRVRLAGWGTAACVCIALAPTVRADNYPRQPGIDIQNYRFQLTLNDDNDEITGESTATVRFVRSDVRQVVFDLTSASGGKGMTVAEVSGAARYSHRGDRLTIVPAGTPKEGEIRQFTVKYRGIPSAGLKIVKNKYGERCFFSQNWPDQARQWLPTVDHPYDKATSEFVIKAPSKYEVVANGLMIEQLSGGDGTRTTRWKQSVPIATWLNNIGVAQFSSRTFATAAGVPLQNWVFHQDREAGIVTFEEPMRRAIQFYHDHVGPYPYEKLAAVQNGAANAGGMEHASAIFYGQNVVNGKPASGLVAHETAHQWFGDSVTEKDWDDVWLSEGFATYFSLLTTEYYEGREAFVAGLRRNVETILATEKRMPGVAVVQNKAWKGIPNQIVYQKGGWALHLLRGQVGTETFWTGIREYYRRYRDGNASTADFRKVMEEAAGQDLGWFFQQWLYRAGTPVVEGGWKYNAAAKKVEIDLKQTQGGEPYRLPLEVGIGGTVHRIEMTRKQQSFEVEAERAPASVELDPNTWMLMDAKFTKR